MGMYCVVRAIHIKILYSEINDTKHYWERWLISTPCNKKVRICNSIDVNAIDDLYQLLTIITKNRLFGWSGCSDEQGSDMRGSTVLITLWPLTSSPNHVWAWGAVATEAYSWCGGRGCGMEGSILWLFLLNAELALQTFRLILEERKLRGEGRGRREGGLKGGGRLTS